MEKWQNFSLENIPKTLRLNSPVSVCVVLYTGLVTDQIILQLSSQDETGHVVDIV